jgi:hypothetical protein
MNIEIFVQSRGFSREHDYHWQKLSRGSGANTKLIEDPVLYATEVKPLIDIRSEVFSVVFGRADEQVYLLVSGLPSKRIDVVCNRPISNSVMWASNGSDNDESWLRALAIYALSSQVSAQSEQLKLENKLDQLIIPDDNSGFSVRFEQLLPEKLITREKITSLSELTAQPVEIYSDVGVRKLSEDLETHFLSKRGQIKVVVTGNKSKTVLDNPKILRGISKFDLIESKPTTSHQNSFLLQQVDIRKIVDNAVKHIFPSLISVALTALIFLATPLKNFIAPPPSQTCPPVPNIEILNLSRRFVVGEPAILLGDYNPQRISRVVLLDETKRLLGGEAQQIQLFPNTKTWKYIYSPGFQVPGRKRLVLQGFDQNGKIIIEQIIPAIVIPDSSTAGSAD